jgi:hypothetical protein
MGLGGFFKYDKPGPGVRKDAPKKKMFFVFLEIWSRNFFKLIPVNLVYTFMSLLFLPGGLAAAGMTNVARNLARDKHSFGLSDFFDTIRKNWKQALPAGIINNLITSVLSFAIFFYYMDIIHDEGGFVSIAGMGLCVACFIVFSFMKYHFWLLVITFKLSLWKIYKNCFTFAFANLFPNLLISLVNILVYGGTAFLIFCGIITNILPWEIAWLPLLVMAMVYPGFTHIFTQMMVFPKVKKLMIDPYYEAHPGEDVDLRRNLGLEIAEEEEEALFDDEKSFTENDE